MFLKYIIALFETKKFNIQRSLNLHKCSDSTELLSPSKVDSPYKYLSLPEALRETLYAYRRLQVSFPWASPYLLEKHLDKQSAHVEFSQYHRLHWKSRNKLASVLGNITTPSAYPECLLFMTSSANPADSHTDSPTTSEQLMKVCAPTRPESSSRSIAWRLPCCDWSWTDTDNTDHKWWGKQPVPLGLLNKHANNNSTAIIIYCAYFSNSKTFHYVFLRKEKQVTFGSAKIIGTSTNY